MSFWDGLMIGRGSDLLDRGDIPILKVLVSLGAEGLAASCTQNGDSYGRSHSNYRLLTCHKDGVHHQERPCYAIWRL